MSLFRDRRCVFLYRFMAAPLCIVGVIAASYALYPAVPAAADEVVFLTAGASWTVPDDWNSANNSIEVIGGGGGSSPGSGSVGGAGGGGGAYSKITNLTLTPGASISYSIGAAGGAAGPGGVGGNGSSGLPGAGGAAGGGSGGAGGCAGSFTVAQTGTEWGSYGSGGGGCGYVSATLGAGAAYGGGGGGGIPLFADVTGQGAQGLIVITYDSAAPVVSALSPAHGTLGVSVGTALGITFDTAVVAVTGKNIVVRQYDDDSTVDTIAADSGQVTIDGAEVTISLSAPLESGVAYYVLADAGAFEGADSGLSSKAIDDKDAWNFRTAHDFGANAQAYEEPGTYEFEVPAHSSITVHVYGGGGGGTGYDVTTSFKPGSVGGFSAFDDGGGAEVRAEGGGWRRCRSERT